MDNLGGGFQEYICGSIVGLGSFVEGKFFNELGVVINSKGWVFDSKED